MGMDREWEIGTQLRAALQQPDGSVPGFMKVCSYLTAVVSLCSHTVLMSCRVHALGS